MRRTMCPKVLIAISEIARDIGTISHREVGRNTMAQPCQPELTILTLHYYVSVSYFTFTAANSDRTSHPAVHTKCRTEQGLPDTSQSTQVRPRHQRTD